MININKSNLKFVEVPEDEPLKNECKHFLELVNSDIQPLTDGNEGLEVVEVLSSASKFEIKK